MKVHKTSFFSLVILMIASVTAQGAQLASAKVVDVVGTVTKYSADGSQSPLKVGDLLKEGDSISVTALSEADLVFSNGSELTIEENTSVNIATLQQEPFSGNQSYEQLQADPSKSQTLLELNYGKLSGHVKELRSDSKFHVETPLGTAAIRGTQWSALLIYNAEREEFLLVVKNLDGLVDIISRYLGTIEYGEGNIGDKGYDSSIDEQTRELIPQDHTVVLRLRKSDPYFDDLLQIIKNYAPTGPKPVITPGPGPGPGPGDPEDDDFGIIVVSPEGQQN
ncbi:MAG TPA: FecR domain-containing protein [Opitutales bacterium]|nr:FecR domain-containing protein [Opitutales bacterium]